MYSFLFHFNFFTNEKVEITQNMKQIVFKIYINPFACVNPTQLNSGKLPVQEE